MLFTEINAAATFYAVSFLSYRSRRYRRAAVMTIAALPWPCVLLVRLNDQICIGYRRRYVRPTLSVSSSYLQN